SVLHLLTHVVEENAAQGLVLGVVGTLAVPVDGFQLLDQRDEGVMQRQRLLRQALARRMQGLARHGVPISPAGGGQSDVPEKREAFLLSPAPPPAPPVRPAPPANRQAASLGGRERFPAPAVRGRLNHSKPATGRHCSALSRSLSPH